MTDLHQANPTFAVTKEIALTSDPAWRTTLDTALAQLRVQTAANSEPANLLQPALVTLWEMSGAEAAALVRHIDFATSARRGAVRVSPQNVILAERVRKKLSTTMGCAAPFRWTERRTVLAALYLHAKRTTNTPVS